MAKIKPKAMAGDIPVYCSHDKIVSITKVVPNPRNPNIHPERQIEILSKIIQEQGWRQPITISNRSGFIVKGHGRYLAAVQFNANDVPVDYQDYENEAEEWADLIADNRIAELSNMNEDLLSELLLDISDTDFDILLTGMEYADIDSLINNDEALTVIDNIMDEPEQKREEPPKGNMDYTPSEEPTETTPQDTVGNTEETQNIHEPTTEEPQITTTTNFNYKEQYGVIVMCKDETEQQEVYEKLADDGYECKVVTT